MEVQQAITKLLVTKTNNKRKILLKILKTPTSKHVIKNLNYTEAITQKLLVKQYTRITAQTVYWKSLISLHNTNSYWFVKIKSLFAHHSPTVIFMYIFILWTLYRNSMRYLYTLKNATLQNIQPSLVGTIHKAVTPANILFKKHYKHWKTSTKFINQPLMAKIIHRKNKALNQVTLNLQGSKYIHILTVFLLAQYNYNKNHKKKTRTSLQNLTRLELFKASTKSIFMLCQGIVNQNLNK